MNKLNPKQLLEKFSNAIGDAAETDLGNEIPFVARLSRKSYLIFLKNLSPAYFTGSPDISRIQLPMLNHPAIHSSMPLVVLGYDSDNDAFVGWNPTRMRHRINSRNNVSLYSRISLQRLPNLSGFNKGKLTSGELFYTFHSTLLPTYFNSIEEIFKEDSRNIVEEEHAPSYTPMLVSHSIRPEILSEVTDQSVLAEIQSLLQEAKILEAASLCYDRYGEDYPNMTLVDWLNIIKSMYRKIT